MSSDFGGGFDTPRAPMMSQGDEDSVDESKMPDLSMVTPELVAEMIPMVMQVVATSRKPLRIFSTTMMTSKTGMQ